MANVVQISKGSTKLSIKINAYFGFLFKGFLWKNGSNKTVFKKRVHQSY